MKNLILGTLGAMIAIPIIVLGLMIWTVVAVFPALGNTYIRR